MRRCDVVLEVCDGGALVEKLSDVGERLRPSLGQDGLTYTRVSGTQLLLFVCARASIGVNVCEGMM